MNILFITEPDNEGIVSYINKGVSDLIMNKKHIINFIVPVLLVGFYLLCVRITSEQFFFNAAGWIAFGLGIITLVRGKYFKGGMLALIGLVLVYQF